MAEIFRPNSDKNEYAAELIGPKVSTATGWKKCVLPKAECLSAIIIIIIIIIFFCPR